jgi:hypothetical protein
VTSYFGIYRATVVSNSDPLSKRRLQVLVPEVTGEQPVWAAACVPQGSRAQPKSGTVIWLQFESGDVNRPVWVGVMP